MWQEIITALGLVLILEGILPFLSPDRLRKSMLAATELDDSTLRIVGFCSMVFGLIIIYWIK